MSLFNYLSGRPTYTIPTFKVKAEKICGGCIHEQVCSQKGVIEGFFRQLDDSFKIIDLGNVTCKLRREDPDAGENSESDPGRTTR